MSILLMLLIKFKMSFVFTDISFVILLLLYFDCNDFNRALLLKLVVFKLFYDFSCCLFRVSRSN